MHKCAIVYDTSYLMNGFTVLSTETYLGELISDALYGPTQQEFQQTVFIVQIVPLEVQEEIGRLLVRNNSTSRQVVKKASRARNAIVTLRQDEHSLYKFLEPRLTGVFAPHSCQTLLGADSLVDRLLLGYATSLLASKTFEAVFIATLDGGIKNELVQLRKASRSSIYYIDTPGPSFDLQSYVYSSVSAIIQRNTAISAERRAQAQRQEEVARQASLQRQQEEENRRLASQQAQEAKERQGRALKQMLFYAVAAIPVVIIGCFVQEYGIRTVWENVFGCVCCFGLVLVLCLAIAD